MGVTRASTAPRGGTAPPGAPPPRAGSWRRCPPAPCGWPLQARQQAEGSRRKRSSRGCGGRSLRVRRSGAPLHARRGSKNDVVFYEHAARAAGSPTPPSPSQPACGLRRPLLNGQPHRRLQPRVAEVAGGALAHGHRQRQRVRVALGCERLQGSAPRRHQLQPQQPRHLVVCLACRHMAGRDTQGIAQIGGQHGREQNVRQGRDYKQGGASLGGVAHWGSES